MEFVEFVELIKLVKCVESVKFVEGRKRVHKNSYFSIFYFLKSTNRKLCPENFVTFSLIMPFNPSLLSFFVKPVSKNRLANRKRNLCFESIFILFYKNLLHNQFYRRLI